MKERQSLKFANWSKSREIWYQKECDEILYRIKSEIIFDSDLVFIMTGKHKLFLLTIENPKSKWYQIWIKLREEKDDNK